MGRQAVFVIIEWATRAATISGKLAVASGRMCVGVVFEGCHEWWLRTSDSRLLRHSCVCSILRSPGSCGYRI